MKGAILVILTLATLFGAAVWLFVSELPPADPQREEEALQQLARDLAKESPDAAAAVQRFATAVSSAFGDATIEQRFDDLGKQYAAGDAKLRAQLAALNLEKERLDSIVKAQHALVAGVIRETLRTQAEGIRGADWKSFWLGVASSLCATGIIAASARIASRGTARAAQR